LFRKAISMPKGVEYLNLLIFKDFFEIEISKKEKL